MNACVGLVIACMHSVSFVSACSIKHLSKYLCHHLRNYPVSFCTLIITLLCIIVKDLVG